MSLRDKTWRGTSRWRANDQPGSSWQYCDCCTAGLEGQPRFWYLGRLKVCVDCTTTLMAVVLTPRLPYTDPPVPEICQ